MRAKNYATLTNTGRGCAVTAKTTSSLAMSVTVSLPERLKANLSRGKGSGALLFEGVAMRPTVMISDPLLDSDFGCEVLAFEFMEKEAYVTTQNGCLAYVWQ